jgi:hypothetical protein
MKKMIWLSFDLGVNGDYEGMYAWLDEHAAKECGDSMALVQFPTEGDVVSTVRKDIKKTVKCTPRTRVYMVYRGDGDKIKGVWLIGSRKQAPWTGYGRVAVEAEADEA